MTSNEPHSGQPRLRRLFIRLGEDISFAHYDPRQPESFSFFPYESTPAASRVVNLRGALDTLPPEGTQTTDAQVLVGTGAATLGPTSARRTAPRSTPTAAPNRPIPTYSTTPCRPPTPSCSSACSGRWYGC